MENGTTIIALTERRFNITGQLPELNTKLDVLEAIVFRSFLKLETFLATSVIRVIT